MTEAISQPIANIASLPTHEMARLEALRRYNILDTPPEKAFDRITSLAVRLFDVPTALISLVDESRAWFKSSFGFDRPEVSRDASICNFALLYDDVLVIPDTQQDERFVCNPFVQSDPGLRFYAGAPLLTEDGFNLGTLCLLDTQPHPTFTLEQKATLVDLAAMVMDELKLRLSTQIITQFDAALWEVTQGVSGVTGKAFFSALVQHLSTALGVNYACISLLINENPERVKTIAFYAQGEIIDNVEYELQDTPCLDVIRQQKMGCYVSNIQALFPDDHFLIALNIESYASIPFFDSRGKLLGLLGIMDNKPLENISLVESLLPLFAMRIAAELERQQAEEMQQEAAQHLQLYADVVRNTQVGIVVWQLEDPNDPGSFRLIIANPAASAVTGFDFESIIGKTMAESFPKLTQSPRSQQYLEVVCTGRSQDFGEVVSGEDRISAGIYSLKAFPLPNHCLGLAFENITARKQIEAQLHDSQHYNQQITEALPGILFVHDLIQQQNVYTNRQITDLLGYTSEQVQLMGSNAIATLVHPDDLERVLSYFEAFHTASDEAILGIEYRARHANGHYCWLYTQSVVFKRSPEGLPQQVLGIAIDISDRKRSEQALQNSEAWSKLAAQVAQLGAWRLYLDTNLVEIDERMRQIWGEPNDAVMIPLSLILERIHPDDRERVANAVNVALDPNGSGVYEIEYRIVWNDGTERWVLAKGQVQFEGKGTARRAVDFFGTALDISDVYDQLRLRKQAEAVLTQQEQRYRYIFEAVSVAIWEEDFSEAQAAIQQLKAMGIQDFDQYFTEHPEFVQQMASLVRIQDVNQAALQMFGAKEKAQLLSSLGQIFVPETQAAFIGELLAIAHEETFFAAETVVQTLQGDRLNVWFSITFPPASESYNHVLVSLLDITQRKQTEQTLQQHSERLNLLYETMKDLLCAERPLDLMNRLFNRLSSLMDLHYYYQFKLVEKNGKSQLKLMNYSGISEEQAKLFETIEIGEAVCGLVAQECRQLVLNKAEIATHPNAQAICLMGVSAYSGQPLMVQGRLLGTLSFASLTRTEFTSEEVNLLQAISEQVAIALDRAELVASLQQQTEDLAQVNRVKDEFLAVLSHELRSPLNPILGWTKLLQTGKFDSQRTKQALEVIERNAKQQTQLIDDLLDISKILRGKLILREAPVDLALTIEATLETMRLAAEAKSIQIKTEFDSFLPPVLGDGGRLQQIVLNLLSNAIKFTPNGGRVEVTLKRIKSEAQIKVKDNGKGITPDFLPFVFESFRQEDGKTTRKFGGLGLGLAIVRQLTELHGGTVQASSQGEGTGATFTVCLPLMKTTSLRVNRSSSNDGCFGEVNVLEGIKVLVVDDEADMRNLVVMILEQAGAITKTATSAAEALTMFTEFQPMLFMSDIGMPDMDGYMLMQKIRALPPEQGGFVPAIALTAYAGECDQQQALKVGFQKHLPKPIEPEALVKAISELINLTLP